MEKFYIDKVLQPYARKNILNNRIEKFTKRNWKIIYYSEFDAKLSFHKKCNHTLYLVCFFISIFIIKFFALAVLLLWIYSYLKSKKIIIKISVDEYGETKIVRY